MDVNTIAGRSGRQRVADSTRLDFDKGLEPMRIAMIAESPSMPSGFGQQTRMLCEQWARMGHEIFLLTGSIPLKKLELPNTEEWRFNDLLDLDRIESSLNAIQPQVLLIFGWVAFLSKYLHLHSVATNCPVFFWIPYEGMRVPDAMARSFRGLPPNAGIHLTTYGQKIWRGTVDSEYVIPHGYDPEIWKPEPGFGFSERASLRRKWAEKIRFPLWPDDLVVLNCDRNVWHKKWDATCDYVKKLQRRVPNRRVVLLAHTKKRQVDGPPNPPGFDIPEVVRLFGIENNVAFTNFDWWESVSREDLVEMMRICDIRLTTSAGEGFGIPIIEAAGCRTLQIVNEHTTARELLGAENPMVVPSSTVEENMGSLWALPDVDAMVTRTLEFLHEPVLANYAVDSAKQWVDMNFTAETVAQTFIKVFTEEIQKNPRETLQVTRCWGLHGEYMIPRVMGDCGRVAMKLTDQPILELGTRDGTFLSVCAELGANVAGIEDRQEWLDRVEMRARPFVLQQSISEPWPHAELIVVTDMQDVWLERLGSPEAVEDVFARMAKYPWVLVRFRTRYTWGQPTLSKQSCHVALENHGLAHRIDLEKLLKGKFPNFQHEVWQRADITEIPETVQQFLGTTNGD